MAHSTERFKHDSIQEPTAVVNYLEALSKGFKSGSLVFSSDERNFTIQPGELINMAVEAKRKGDDIKLAIKFRWTESPKKPKPGELTIEPLED